MAEALPLITTGTGTQNATQDPQTAGTSAGAGTPTSSVQPGSFGSLDTATGGVPLNNTTLSTVALSTKSSTVVKPDPIQPSSNAFQGSLSIIFFLLAVGLLVAIFGPSKNTTN